VIAEIVPFTFPIEFMILMSAGACWWKSALLIAAAISWSIILGSATLIATLRISHLSAVLEPDVWAGTGLAAFCWFGGGTVSYHLVGLSSNIISPFFVDIGFAVGFGVGFGAGAVFSFGFGFGFSFGLGMDLSYLPGCSC